MNERWLPVPGYEGLYEVSDFGNVRSLHRSFRPRIRGNLLTPAMSGRYLMVVLYREKRRKSWLIHQLVLLAFRGARPPEMESLHGPGGRLDNRLANLSYGTRAKNSGPDRVRDGTSNRGERCGTAKLTEAIVLECRRRYAAGEAQQDLTREFGVHPGTMSQAITGKRWAWLPGALPIDRSRHGTKREAHHAAKLTAGDAAEIRRRYATGERQRPLAREFGISQAVVSKITRGELWK